MNSLNGKLVLVWIIAFVGEFLVPYVLSIFVDNYSHMKTVMSALGSTNNVVGRLYSGWLVIFGILVVVYSILFYRVCTDNMCTSVKVGTAILVAYGIGSGIICGLFPVDETREMVSVSAKIHGISIVFSFMALMLLPLILRKFLVLQGARSASVVSCLAFVLCLLWLVLQIISEREQFSNTFLGSTGLWQRLYLFTIYSYITFVSFVITK